MDRRILRLLQFTGEPEEIALLQRIKRESATEDECIAKAVQLLINPLTEGIQKVHPNIQLPSFNLADFNSNPSGYTAQIMQTTTETLSNTLWNHSLTYLTAKENAPRLVNEIFDDWERLSVIVSRHLDVLRHRWTRKTAEKRKKILTEAWPGMSARHRPDFNALRLGLKGPEHRDAWIVPYVNLEDLSKPKSLPNLFESRASESPEHFAWRDSAPVEMANAYEAIEELRAYGHTMLLSGQKTRQTYGTLVSWSDDRDSMHSIYWGYGFHLGVGWVLLETQRKLYRFLFSRQVTEANTEAAYLKPQPFGFDHIRKLASAKRDEAEDQLWALRENPGHFRDTVEEAGLRNNEIVDFFNCNKPKIVPLLHVACRVVITRACRDLVYWDIMLEDLKRLEAIRASTEVKPMTRLPGCYREALARFSVLVTLIKEQVEADVFDIIATSPPLKHCFEVAVENGNKLFRLKCPTSEIDHQPRPAFLDLLGNLRDHRIVRMMGATNILDEVQHLISSDASQRSLVTAAVTDKISELAAFAEISDTINRHQPRIREPSNRNKAEKAAEERMDIASCIEKTLYGLKVGEYVQPRSSFDFPSHKKRNLPTVDKLRAAETKLDAFWGHVDAHFQKHKDRTLLALMEEHLTMRKLERTAPWQPPQGSQAQEVAGARKQINNEMSLMWDPFDVDKVDTGLKFLPSEPTMKAKTRGQADPLKTEPQPEAVTARNTPTKVAQTFQLSIKSFKTMTSFFPTDRQGHTPGKVLWKDFVQAMYTLDFSIRSMDGSAWYFEPVWKQDAPITFHEPHPSNEIPFFRLKFYGSRLARKYGWSSESFELA